MNERTRRDLRPNLLEWALDDEFLGKRMSFIAGPRQIGKTTLLQRYLKEVGHVSEYFNWDVTTVRAAARRDPEFFIKEEPWKGLLPVVFDELHKVPRWKSLLKGLYDTWRGRVRFIVTASARLDFMRRSGDSLVGRYFLFRRLPLAPRECVTGAPLVPDWVATRPIEPPSAPAADWREATAALLSLNGFPEPFLAGTQRFLTRWQVDHLSLLVTEDLRDLTRIEHVLRAEMLADLLRSRVGSPLSTNSLARDLSSSFAAVGRWLDGLELVYLTFRLRPYAHRLERAIRKEPKLYFWDWSLPDNPAARFENFVAVQLMRAVSSWNERGLGRFSVCFAKTRDGIECDFVIVDNKKPVLLVEAKQTDSDMDPSLIKMRRWLGGPQAVQVVGTPGVLRVHREPQTWVMSVDRFLQLLP